MQACNRSRICLKVGQDTCYGKYQKSQSNEEANDFSKIHGIKINVPAPTPTAGASSIASDHYLK